MQKDATAGGKKYKFSLDDYHTCLQAWMIILENLITELDPTTIFNFAKEIIERAAFINFSSGEKWQEAYPPELVSLLPKEDKDWVKRYSNII